MLAACSPALHLEIFSVYPIACSDLPTSCSYLNKCSLLSAHAEVVVMFNCTEPRQRSYVPCASSGSTSFPWLEKPLERGRVRAQNSRKPSSILTLIMWSNLVRLYNLLQENIFFYIFISFSKLTQDLWFSLQFHACVLGSKDGKQWACPVML